MHGCADATKRDHESRSAEAPPQRLNRRPASQMPTPDYSPVPQGEDDVHSPESAGKYPPEAIKPVTYYGEGEFDPPSSDDEDELLLEKSLTRKSPEDAEQQGEGLGDGDGELVVGGKVRRTLLSCLRPIDMSAVHVEASSTVLAALPGYMSVCSCDHGSSHWSICGFII